MPDSQRQSTTSNRELVWVGSNQPSDTIIPYYRVYKKTIENEHPEWGKVESLKVVHNSKEWAKPFILAITTE
jgi:hypothetical protein